MAQEVRRMRKVFLGCLVGFFSMLALGASSEIRELTPEERITPEELREFQLKHADFVLFDARGSEAYDTEHIEGAILPLPRSYYRERSLFMARVIGEAPNLDLTLAESMKNYPKDTAIVTYCNRDCKASAFLLLKLKELGFNRVRAMEEGIGEWKDQGYPVTVGA